MRSKLHEIPDAKYDKQIHSTPVENVRQIRLFLQNKPNFSQFLTWKWRFHQKTNPIQTQNKANINLKTKVNYENKANQTQ